MINYLAGAIMLVVIAWHVGTINAGKSWESGVSWARADERNDEKMMRECEPRVSKTCGALITVAFTLFVVIACYMLTQIP